MHLGRNDIGLGIALAWLAAATLVWVGTPDRSRMRPVSIEAMTLPSQKIGTSETVKLETDWAHPQGDVYVVGWSTHIPAPPAVVSLIAPPGETVIFRAVGGSSEIKPQFFPGSSGFLLKRGEQLRALYTVTNTGPAGETHGAIVLIYFVPAHGN